MGQVFFMVTTHERRGCYERGCLRRERLAISVECRVRNSVKQQISRIIDYSYGYKYIYTSA
jgi:hypothetical protein